MIFNTFITAAVLASIGMASGTVIPVGNSTDAAPFGINTGHNSQDNVAWVSGQSQCNFVIVGPAGANPCGRAFGLNGQSGFTLEGCGNGLWINQNGNLYANCVALSEAGDCGVTTSFHCT